VHHVAAQLCTMLQHSCSTVVHHVAAQLQHSCAPRTELRHGTPLWSNSTMAGHRKDGIGKAKSVAVRQGLAWSRARVCVSVCVCGKHWHRAQVSTSSCTAAKWRTQSQ
jgi:hypothetical protein